MRKITVVIGCQDVLGNTAGERSPDVRGQKPGERIPEQRFVTQKYRRLPRYGGVFGIGSDALLHIELNKYQRQRGTERRQPEW
ncbi:hypothetical protein D3C78_1402720 [compost metagenome]